MLWPALANGLPEVGLVPWGSSLFCVGGENDVSSAITEKALLGSEVQNTLVKIPIVLKAIELDLQGQI